MKWRSKVIIILIAFSIQSIIVVQPKTLEMIFNHCNCVKDIDNGNNKGRVLRENKELKLTTRCDQKGFTVNICFGTPEAQCFNSKLVLDQFFTWIPDVANPQPLLHKYAQSKSDTFIETHSKAMITFENNHSIRGRHIKDTMWFNSKPLAKNIVILTASESDYQKDIEGVLALGYMPAPNERHYSIIDQLSNDSIISHMVFSIKYFSDIEGIIEIGRIPLSIMNDYYYYGRCNAIKTGNQNESGKRQWECQLRDMAINHISITKLENQSTRSEITFDYNIEHILVPIDVMLRLESIIFKDLIKDGNCNFGFKNNHYKITCENDDYIQLDQLEVIFEDWKMVIPFSCLFTFDPIDNEHEFLLAHKDGSETFVLGTRALRLFEMVFDKTNDEIGFYSSSYVSHISESEISKPIRHDNNEDDKEQIDEKEEKDRPFVPPFHQDDNKDMNSNDKVIPQKGPISFTKKFFISFFVILLIVISLFLIWYAFRYYRRKHYDSKSFYYKDIKGIF